MRNFAFVILIAIPAYWLAVMGGAFEIVGVSKWVSRFPYTSPLADLWMEMLLAGYWFTSRGGQPLWKVFGIGAGSVMVFVGLTAVTFRLSNLNRTWDISDTCESVSSAFLLVYGAILCGFAMRSSAASR